MDNESSLQKKLSTAIAILTLLCFVYASSPPLRYVVLKLEQYVRYRMRRIAYELRHATDPAWKRELADRPELFTWPQSKPEWWKEVESGSIPVPPPE